jgi:hypothetical protein
MCVRWRVRNVASRKCDNNEALHSFVNFPRVVDFKQETYDKRKQQQKDIAIVRDCEASLI